MKKFYLYITDYDYSARWTKEWTYILINKNGASHWPNHKNPLILTKHPLIKGQKANENRYNGKYLYLGVPKK